MIIRRINDQDIIRNEEINAWEASIDDLAKAIVSEPYVDLKLIHALRDSYAVLTFVDQETIRELNRDNRQIDKVTDVLSFPMLSMKEGKLEDSLTPLDYEKDENGNDVLNLGDIIICPEIALKNAEEYGHSAVREIAFLTAHSLLHLLGYDHIAEDDEKLMILRQKQLMVDIGMAFDDEEAAITRHEDEKRNNGDNIAYPAGSECAHCGYVALLGRPNAGKSTLVNYITGMKVAIVSHKPQTTRTNIRSIYNTDDTQIIFVDTPGVHNPKSKLAEIMVSNSFKAVKNADAVILMADGRFKDPGKVECDLIDVCRENKKKLILAVNKSDEVAKESLLPLIAEYSKLYEFTDIIPISAKTGDNVDLLLEKAAELLPAGPRLFDSEYMTDQTEREIARELIREQLLHYTDQEVPHGTAVEITEFKEKLAANAEDEYDRELVVISASIICERESHRAIILGKNGQMIKRIGTAARRNIERMCGCKVYLDLFVKVRSDWKNNDIMLKDFGYCSEDDD